MHSLRCGPGVGSRILMKGIQTMTLTLIGLLFGPLLIMTITMFFLQDKGRRYILTASGIIFFLTALYLLILPHGQALFHIPQILWKFLTLGTVGFLFFKAIRDRRYLLSTLSALQLVILILSEILLSPDEPAEFLWLQMDGKLLFITGAFLVSMILPIFCFNHKASDNRASRECLVGIFFMMAAFTGILSARSLTGLFLFAQWGYLGSSYMNRAFGEPQKERLIPLLQQLSLTVWIGASVLVYAGKGTMLVEEMMSTGGVSGLFVALVFLFIFSMGLLIPEKHMLREVLSWPSSLMGLWMLLFSLLSPFSVLFKFRMLFLYNVHNLAAAAVSLGALLMVANAFYAGNAKSDQEGLTHMVLFVSGWGIVSLFTGLEGAFFSVGYILAAAIAIAFLYCSNCCLQSGQPSGDTELSNTGILSVLKAIVLGLFLFAPFNLAMLSHVYIRLMQRYGLAMLFVTVGLVVMAADILCRLLPLLHIRKTSENHTLTGVSRVILPILLIAVIAVNLLGGPIYRLLQSQLLAEDIWFDPSFDAFTGLENILPMSGLNDGILYMGLSLAVLVTGCIFVAAARRRRGIDERTEERTLYSLTTWLPSGIRISPWIRAAWITAATLLVGVALSCLRV